MLKVMIKVKTARSVYAQKPNAKTKEIWRYISNFFKSNHLIPTKIMFKEKGVKRNLKANRKNFVRAVKHAKIIRIINLQDDKLNERSVIVEVCDCETQFTCKCGG